MQRSKCYFWLFRWHFMSCKRLLLYLSFILSVVVSQEIIEDVSNRCTMLKDHLIYSIHWTYGSCNTWCLHWHRIYVRVKPLSHGRLNISDLEPNTKYMVKLSYPGSIPVQYDIFFEQDNSDEIVSSSIHKRRIQDTRILSFQTDKVGRVYMKDSTTGLIVCLSSINFEP